MHPNSRRCVRAGVFVAGVLAVAATASSFVTQAPISYWPVGDVSWEFRLLADPPNVPDPPLTDGSATWDEAVMVAIDAFNAIIPDNVLTLSAVTGSSVEPGSADNVNNVGFSDTVYGSGWGSSTLGISISRWSGNRRVENDVLFNATKTWDAYTGPVQGVNDIRRVAIHEFGHSLGLNHPDQAGQVVSAIMNSMASDIDALTQDDIDGILSLYGAIRPIEITQQPQSYTTPAGGDWTLSVTATGSEPISYDWEVSENDGASWADVGVATTSTGFTYPNVIMAQDGWQVRVIISNPAGMLTSEVATLTVTASASDPSITTQPQSTTTIEGEDAVFTAEVGGSPTPSLQWEISTDGGGSWMSLANDATYQGVTIATLTVVETTVAMSGNQFRIVATGDGMSPPVVTSSAATLTVNAASLPEAPVNPNRTNTSPTGFTAIWDVVLNADGYRIDVSTDASFASFVPGFQDLDIGNVSSFDISGLSAGTYYYRLRAYNGAGTSSSSETLTVGVGGRVVNLSTRGRTAEGNDTLIIGFVIKGSGNKPLLIRASGPSLSVLGLNDGTVPNPRLALFQQNGTPIPPGNDDWDHTDAALQAAIGSVFAFPFLEPSVDAAMLVDLPAGIYTVHAQTVTGEPGVTSVELYELDDTAELINVSTRAFVGEGIEVLIPGTFLGTAPKRVLVRAVGETLASLGVNGVLEDPVLEVVPLGQTTPLIANDDWGSEGNEDAIVAASAKVFAFPLPSGSRDAVVLTDLPAAGFTFVVSGKDGATGIVLVELYVVP